MQSLHYASLRVYQVHSVAHVAQVVVGESKLHLASQGLIDVEGALRGAENPSWVLLKGTQKKCLREEKGKRIEKGRGTYRRREKEEAKTREGIREERGTKGGEWEVARV